MSTTARLTLGPDRLVSGAQVVALHRQESLLLVALMFRPRLSSAEAAEILWPSASHMPDTWRDRVNVLISKLRRKLHPFGWTLAVRYNFGWKLERHDRADDRAAQETRAAA